MRGPTAQAQSLQFISRRVFFCLFVLFFLTEFHILQVSLTLKRSRMALIMILMIPLPKCWDYKCIRPHFALADPFLKYGVNVPDTQRANRSVHRCRKDTGHDDVTYLRLQGGSWLPILKLSRAEYQFPMCSLTFLYSSSIFPLGPPAPRVCLTALGRHPEWSSNCNSLGL